MLKLLLDENISPSLVPLLWEEEIDSVALRDRGKLRISDHRVFALAQEEERAIATINTSDFERLARRVEAHAGVVTMPSGGTRGTQFERLMRAVDFVRKENIFLPSFRDRFIHVSENGDVAVETVKAQARATLQLVPRADPAA